MLTSIRQKQAGFTFTELLVALTINLLLFAALITLFLSNITHYKKSLNTSRLNLQLQTMLMIMSNDIRRAGYWANANSDVGINQNNNPFMASGVDISVGTGNNCILFAYDRDGDGLLPSVSSSVDDERYGYRLNGQVIQARPPGATFTCDAAASSWENMTDSNIINITNLTFNLTTTTLTTGPGVQGVILRNVDVTIVGQLVSDPSITQTLTEHIRIRNDKFIP